MTSGFKGEVTKAKNAVFRLLKYRARSRKEIEDRLKQKKFSQDTINLVIDYFDKLEFINDREFASSWLNSRIAKPLGMRRIFFELRQKGISKDIIEEAQSKLKERYNEYEVVSELVRNKMKRLANLESNKAKRRVYNFLIRRGFSIDVINEVFSEL